MDRTDDEPSWIPTLPKYVADKIPRSHVCELAYEVARQALPEPILNHSLRVFLIAQWLRQQDRGDLVLPDNQELLFVACIYHDLGATHFGNGPQRFEVEGADAARHYLLSQGFSVEESHRVWVAIAVHTSPGIAEKIDGLARLVREGVLVDFSETARKRLNAEEFSREIEEYLPRLNVEKVLGDAVVGQAAGRHELPSSTNWPSTEKHPAASWPGILLRAHLENPDHDGVNPAF